jgi:aminoglycoside phosphotransferase family enzyme/predicted kinase
MLRFPDDALLSQRLETGKIANDEVFQLAAAVADFHQQASLANPSEPWGSPDLVLREMIDNFHDVRSAFSPAMLPDRSLDSLCHLEGWSLRAFASLRAALEIRRQQGMVRECHGDLHLANVIRWQGRWTPFDGIEFNDEFRWIDVLSDAAFLAMDFAAQGHLDLSRSFINAYFEQTGDYGGLPVLRWYLVYRALVRAKVAAIRSQQPEQTSQAQESERRDCLDHVDLAWRFADAQPPHLWITHGVSGSGKTTGTEQLIQKRGAIRLRSDVERKRLFGLNTSRRPKGDFQHQVYGEQTTEQTYERLRASAASLLRVGESVVVDATFLQRRHRDLFRQLANKQGVPFAILSFSADRVELERRIVARISHDNDASDANLQVLQSQLSTMEPLSEEERKLCESPR